MRTAFFRAALASLCLVLGACLGSGDEAGAPAAPNQGLAGTAVHSQEQETLTLTSLRSGSRVYKDVTIRLTQDGTWSLLSSTAVEDRGQVTAAVLLPARSLNTLGSEAQPSDLVIRRLHQDSQLHGEARIRFVGERWSFPEPLQAATALSAADFATNPGLVAQSTHVVALHTGPTVSKQRFPVRLQGGTFRVCAETGDSGTDRVTLLDAAGAALAAVESGQPCQPVTVTAGQYTLQHEYSGSGPHRPVFFRHRAKGGSPLLATARQPMSAAAVPWLPLGDPEYWAVATPDGQYLQASLVDVYGDPCLGGNLLLTGRNGPAPSFNVLQPSTLFRVTRGSSVQFGLPMGCDSPSYGYVQHQFELPMDGSFSILELGATQWGDSGAIRQAPITVNPSESFVLQTPYTPLGVAANGTFAGKLFAGRWAGDLVPNPQNFQVNFRYFPNGVPVSATLSGGEVALWMNENCTGATVVARNTDVPWLRSTWGPFQSLRLGPDTTATFFESTDGVNPYSGRYATLTTSDCRSLSAAGVGIAASGMKVQAFTVDLVVTAGVCDSCPLSGLDFTVLAAQTGTCDLAGVKLTHSNLDGAVFSGCHLTGADFTGSTFRGAIFSAANLQGVNLCSMDFSAPTFGIAAQFNSAHLRDTKLSGANLANVNFNNANLFSSGGDAKSCTTACGGGPSTCASVAQANLNGADFSGAYLAGLNLANAPAHGTLFTGAVLFGANLTGADLSYDTATGTATDFSFAMLQGADFTGANVAGASFLNAYVDTFDTSPALAYVVKLTTANTSFAGFTTPDASNNDNCVATAKLPAGQKANLYAARKYPQVTVLPSTDSSNICADGSPPDPAGGGSCSTSSWQTPALPLSQATTPAWPDNGTLQWNLCAF